MYQIIISIVAYLVLAPIVGGILAGIDRKMSARMQGRFGPPLLQPFYDVFKLREKESRTVNESSGFLRSVLRYLCFGDRSAFLRGRRSAVGNLHPDAGQRVPDCSRVFIEFSLRPDRRGKRIAADDGL